MRKLYTITQEGRFLPGQMLELSVSDTLNLDTFNLEGFFDQKELKEHALELFPRGLSWHGWRYLNTRHTYGDNVNGFYHDTSCLCEMNLEYVRRSFFSHSPSRLQSIFATETVEEAIKFRTRYREGKGKIFEIECNEYLKVDMNFIYLGVSNISGALLAHKYWQGMASANPFWECIVPLPATIVREVSNLATMIG
ncbi:hypothetical protein [Sphingobacterium siyangense]|uniref:hypothetical protein n=1 Tax=Sphingobacterium siyangense TaxID=459529 RepID=UPI003DA64D19